MRIIDTIEISIGKKTKCIELLVGDLSIIPQAHAIDLLVLSAFPDEYSPTPNSLIGALYKQGISVEDLSKGKALDLREFSSCWLSKKLNQYSINFGQLLCFEPGEKGTPSARVGDVFRSLIPFCDGYSIQSVAMPLLATGDQKESSVEMIRALVEASIHWLGEGHLPLKTLKIVLLEELVSGAIVSEFVNLKESYKQKSSLIASNHKYKYDAFISYSHKNIKEALSLVNLLQKHKPKIRLFLDKNELKSGLVWQKEIFNALESSKTVICIYSPDYLNSAFCIDEFQTAWLMHRANPEIDVLFPILLYTTNLPFHMQLVQFEDVREGDIDMLNVSVENYLKKYF